MNESEEVKLRRNQSARVGGGLFLITATNVYGNAVDLILGRPGSKTPLMGAKTGCRWFASCSTIDYRQWDGPLLHR